MANANYLRQPLYAPQPYSEHFEPSAPPPPSPPSAAAAAAPSNAKFSATGYRDLAWAVLFLIHVALYLGAGGYVLHKYAGELTMQTNTTSTAPTSPASFTYIINPEVYSTTYDPSLTSTSSLYTATGNSTATSTDEHIRLQRDSILLGLSSLAVSALIAMLWLSLTKSYARTMLWAALVADIAVSILMVFVCLLYGAIIGVILFAAFAALKAVWVYWVRERIEFAAVLLEHAVLCVQRWPATVAAAVLSLLVQAMWIVGWGFASVAFYYAATRLSSASAKGSATNADGSQGQMQQDSSLSYVVVFGTLVSFYWGSQVVRNTLHVTVSGVASTWYFLYPQGDTRNPTASSMKRALTTSFGSICLGSLVLSVVRAMRMVVNMMAQQPGNVRNGGAAAVRAVCYCLAQCLLSILDRVVEFINAYAYAYVAMSGAQHPPHLPLLPSSTLASPTLTSALLLLCWCARRPVLQLRFQLLSGRQRCVGPIQDARIRPYHQR